MAIEEIRGYRYRCDVADCGKEHVDDNATAHYTNSVPPGWARLDLLAAERTSRQLGGVAYRQTLLLCETCRRDVEGGLGPKFLPNLFPGEG